jgi:hypothetical protein
MNHLRGFSLKISPEIIFDCVIGGVDQPRSLEIDTVVHSEDEAIEVKMKPFPEVEHDLFGRVSGEDFCKIMKWWVDLTPSMKDIIGGMRDDDS